MLQLLLFVLPWELTPWESLSAWLLEEVGDDHV